MSVHFRRAAALAAAVLMLAGLASPVLAKGVTKKQAIRKALRHAKLARKNTSHFEVTKKKGYWSIEFFRKKNGAEYSYNVGRRTGIILKRELDLPYRHCRSRRRVCRTYVLKKTARISGFPLKLIKKGTCRYEYENCEGSYEVKFRKGNFKYEYEYLAPTGRLTDISRRYRPKKKAK